MTYLLSMILSLALMVPFFAWGVYTLRARYQYHEELHRVAEWLTVVGVLVFFAIEMSLLRTWMYDRPGMFVLTGLALTVSMVALYGPIMVSLASSVFVEAVMPNMDPSAQSPQFGPAEALERLQDYDAALQEYLVIARIFPKDSETYVRIGNSLVKLERYDEAVKAFGRGFKFATAEEDALSIANRMHVLYKDRLNEPREAKKILERFLERFPQSPRTDSVLRRLSDKGTDSSLERMKERLQSGSRVLETPIETAPAELELDSDIAIPDSTWEAPAVPEDPIPSPPPSPRVPTKESVESELSLDWSTADEESRPDREGQSG